MCLLHTYNNVLYKLSKKYPDIRENTNGFVGFGIYIDNIRTITIYPDSLIFDTIKCIYKSRVETFFFEKSLISYVDRALS